MRVGDYSGSRKSYEDANPKGDRNIGKSACNNHASGWWWPFNLPYGDYIRLEWAAVSIRDFDPGVFPGLLQARDYAWALYERADPRHADDLIEQQIEARRIRQQVLRRDNPPTVHAVVDEAVLHRVVGSPKVMAEQLAHVIKACAQENVTVQVLPYRVGAHPALDSTFTLLEFEPPRLGVVYAEDLMGPSYRVLTAAVKRYERVHDTLVSMALSRCDSIALMERIRTKYEREVVSAVLRRAYQRAATGITSLPRVSL